MKVLVLVRRKSRHVDAVISAVSIANRLQPDFDFELEQVGWLPSGKSTVKPRDLMQTVKKKHKGRHIVAITSAPLRGRWLEYGSRERNIVSTDGWDEDFAPPSVETYIVFQLAYAASTFVAKLSPRQVDSRMVHKGFRGCIFNSTSGRRRFLALLIAGYICKDCEARLREWGVSGKQLESMGYLLSYVRDHAIGKERVMSDSIFIGHGRRRDWEKLRDHLTDVHGLNVDEFDVSPSAGLTTVERLSEMLNRASFAILVMTAEDKQTDGNINTRQNVVHEIGLFQGRLGFPKAIIVKQKEAQEFSNIRGLTYIPFRQGKIDSTFTKIDRVLSRERLIRLPAPPIA